MLCVFLIGVLYFHFLEVVAAFAFASLLVCLVVAAVAVFLVGPLLVSSYLSCVSFCVCPCICSLVVLVSVLVFVAVFPLVLFDCTLLMHASLPSLWLLHVPVASDHKLLSLMFTGHH